ncbi:hypothetical protein CEXT_404241 [Caerostris extrusa]|uniref:Uncharacterized protein n=1 Tax=Caerostris extrusa TaxID=172846 RepID=A0AAV4Q1I4_CAEEX|nr:hypothetical protein CEXT_404241 [Caerostris extrusa]
MSSNTIWNPSIENCYSLFTFTSAARGQVPPAAVASITSSDYCSPEFISKAIILFKGIISIFHSTAEIGNIYSKFQSCKSDLDKRLIFLSIS